jgi:hypothetical protein
MKFLHRLTNDLNRLQPKDHKKISLYAKVMTMIPFLLEFKINQKVFSFKPDIISKSCRIVLLDFNKTSLAIFGFFYNFL